MLWLALLTLLLALSAWSEPLDGRTLYRENCERCHGMSGAGDGPDGKNLIPPPRDFGQAFKYGDTQTAIVKTITNGIPRTGMAAYGKVLEEAEIKALASHVRVLRKQEKN